MASSAVATDTARRLWARFGGEGSAPANVIATAERVHAALRAGLGRWIGAEGYRALIGRALVTAEAEHPALGGLGFLGGDEPALTPIDESRAAVEVSAGMVALVAALIESLGGVIGEEMALRLVDQIDFPNPRAVGRTEAKRGHDG
jgi:hypothetical protein